MNVHGDEFIPAGWLSKEKWSETSFRDVRIAFESRSDRKSNPFLRWLEITGETKISLVLFPYTKRTAFSRQHTLLQLRICRFWHVCCSKRRLHVFLMRTHDHCETFLQQEEPWRTIILVSFCRNSGSCPRRQKHIPESDGKRYFNRIVHFTIPFYASVVCYSKVMSSASDVTDYHSNISHNVTVSSKQQLFTLFCSKAFIEADRLCAGQKNSFWIFIRNGKSIFCNSKRNSPCFSTVA